MPEPDSDCILVCAWDPYHQDCHEQHGVLVCQQCERLVRCIAHDGHGAMLVDGTVVVTETASRSTVITSESIPATGQTQRRKS